MKSSHIYKICAVMVFIFISNIGFCFEIKDNETSLEITFDQTPATPNSDIVKDKTNPKKSKKNNKDIKVIVQESKVKLFGRNQGIRHKKVAVFSINIYEARMYFEDSKSKTTDPQELANSNYIAIKLKPLRSFSGDKLKEAMLMSYSKNNINGETKAQVEFFEVIAKNKVIKNEPFYLVGVSLKDSDELYLMMKGINQKIVGHKGFIKEVFSVWLGEPVDADLQKLKDTLTN